MKDIIANNAKFVLDYGQAILITLIFLLLFIIFKIGRKHKFYLPTTLFGWFTSMVSLLLIIISSLAIIGLQHERETTLKVLDHFDSMLMKKAPELTFKMVSNNSSSTLNDFKGKVVILNLWATWCAPCIKEMPDLSNLHNDFYKNEVVVITLSDESREKLLSFQQSNSFDFLHVYNKQIEWLDRQIGTARPLTFIIDRNGVITEYHTGARSYDFYASRIKKLL